MLTRMNWQTGGPVPRNFDVEVGGFQLSSRSLPDLFAQFARHHDRREMRLQPDWEDTVWKALAAKYPKHIKRAPDKSTNRAVSVRSALNFIRFLAKRVTDQSLVQPCEARRRASICSRCPQALAISGCAVCKDAIQLTVSPPEAVESPEGCSACGCYLPLKVWVPRDQLGPASDYPYHASCWMRETE